MKSKTNVVFTTLLGNFLGVAIWVAAFGLAHLCQNCTAAQREKLVVPTLSQIDAIGVTIGQVVEWARDHGADEAPALETLQAISDKDPRRAVTIARKLLEAIAEKGEPVPPAVIGLVQTVEYALAAEAIQDVMRALSIPTAPSSAPAPSSSASAAPLPSSGL